MIELRALTKSFRTVHGRHYVFRDLSLTFPDGTNIGLIGPNGAGKSTLMRIIGGIDVPDHGAVVTDRRISFPVGLSGGFQGTLSGRDNAKFVCRLYGVSTSEVKEKVSFVESFAELGKYFDMPIKTYSSGMRSRLIFGLSMAFDFDYYLMDEVGAVGDAGFKEKSRELLEAKIGTANVICVSHNMNVIREQCDVAVLLRGGEAIYYADLEEGIHAYQGDAYVKPASLFGKRGSSNRLTAESITPKLIRKARRIIRVARRCGLMRAAEPADGSSADAGDECSRAISEPIENQGAPISRPRRTPGKRPRRRAAGTIMGEDANEAQVSAPEQGSDEPRKRRAPRAARHEERRSAPAAGMNTINSTSESLATPGEDGAVKARGAERARRRRRAERQPMPGVSFPADGSSGQQLRSGPVVRPSGDNASPTVSGPTPKA